MPWACTWKPCRRSRNGTSYRRASFPGVKGWGAQNAWRVLYLNAMWWTFRLPFSAVSTCDVRIKPRPIGHSNEERNVVFPRFFRQLFLVCQEATFSSMAKFCDTAGKSNIKVVLVCIAVLQGNSSCMYGLLLNRALRVHPMQTREKDAEVTHISNFWLQLSPPI